MRGKTKRQLITPRAAASLACPKTAADLKTGDKRLFLLCGAFYLVGIIVGAALYTSSSELLQNYFGYLLGGSVSARTTEKLIFTIIYTLIPQVAALLLCCVFSYCTVGAPLILLLLAGSGASTGLMGAYVFVKLGWLGLLFNLLVIAPATALAVSTLINLAVKGLRASVTLYFIAYRGRTKRLAALNDEIYHALALGGATAFVSSLMQGVLFKLFGSSLV